MKYSLDPQRVVISGASQGIGLELAKAYARRGARLALLARNFSPELQAELLTLGAREVFIYNADVTDEVKMAEITASILERFKGADLVIANAGMGGLNPADAFDKRINRACFEVNYFGQINLFAPFIPTMIEAQKGHLVGVSSLAAFRGLPNAASYSASKSAQRILLESFRVDLKKHGIAVSSIHPGFIKTKMTAHDEFKMPFMIDADECARLIIKAIERKVSHYLFPWPMRLLTLLNRILPDSLYDFIIVRVSKPKNRAVARIF